jgi:hypothetical protein
VHGSLPQWLKRGESIEGILTLGKGWRRRGGKRPAATLCPRQGGAWGMEMKNATQIWKWWGTGVLLGALCRARASNRGVGEERWRRMMVELHQCVSFIGS